jgi:hypothetical protein
MTDKGPSQVTPAPTASKPSTRVPVGRKTGVSLPPPHDLFSSLVAKRFAEMDLDKDGFLSKGELNLAMQNPKFKGDDAAMVATLKSLVGDIESIDGDDESGIENDGATLADITQYDRLREKDINTPVVRSIRARFAHAQSKIAAAGARPLFDGGDPDVFSVRQGLIGDCFVLAAIVALGNIDRARVKAMVKPSKDPRNFEVKFPGLTALLVLEPTDAELALFASSNGIWLSVIEKAYGAALNRDAFFWTESSELDAADKAFGGVNSGVKLVTGNEVDLDFMDLTFEGSTRDKLKTAFSNKKVVTAGVRNSVKELGGGTRSNGLPMGHAYSVLDFDVAADTLRLRNPWGSAGTSFGSTFKMTLTEFDDNFNTICYEQ